MSKQLKIAKLKLFTVDDPGGGALPPAMEISNSCSESKITSVSQQQQSQNTKPSTNLAVVSSSGASNSSDLKYLHKKFKRIASASLGEVTSASESSSSGVAVVPSTAISSNAVVAPFEPVQRPPSSLTPSPTCAKQGVVVGNLVRSSVEVSEQQQQQRVQPIVDETNYSSRLQLTPLSSVGGDHQNLQQQHSNGASLNCANHISDSNSFISSSNHIPREESEEFKPYYPSVNNNSAFNTSSDPSEKNQPLSVSYEGANSAALFYANGGPVGSEVVSTSATATTAPGRYVCPYCSMNCSKPSVLQKHIRRHTNERPFRCDPCGIAFKTKSNLYKHCRSRAHASKSQGEDIGVNLDEDGSLGGSDIDDKELSNSGSDIVINRGSPMDDRVHSPQLLVEKPYKPKFHNAALYTKFDAKLASKFQITGGGGGVLGQIVVTNHNLQQQHHNSIGSSGSGSGGVSSNSNSTTNLNTNHNSAPSTPHYLNGQNVESLEQHISKLISDNEAIVEVVEPPLQKKYHKITGITRGISVSSSSGSGSSNSHDAGSRLATALLHKRNSEEEQLQQQQQQQMLIPQPQYVATVIPSEQQVVISSKGGKVNAPRVINLTTHGYPVVQNHHHQPVPLMVRPVAASGSNEVQYQQPLNLSKPVPSEPQYPPPMEYEQQHSRKRSAEVLQYSREQSPSFPVAQQQQQQQQQQQYQVQAPAPQPAPPPPPQAQQTQPPVTVTDHPKNPERSIIKDLLLNSRGFGVVQNPENENAENLFTCKSCNISFRDAEILKYHTICYCQGNSSNLNSPSSSAPISPVGSPSSSHFMRSKSAASDRFNPTSLKTLARVSLNPPSRNPSTLSKLAKSQLKLPRGRPENIALPPKESSSSSSTASGCPVPEPSSSSSSNPIVAKIVDVVQNPLPSPGPLLGNTRLVDFQSHDGGRSMPPEPNVIVSHVANDVPLHRKHQPSNEPHVLRRVQHPSLQLFGGDVEVVPRNDELRRPHRYTSGGTITYSPEVHPEMHDGPAGRTGMHSGGSFLQLSDSNRSVSPAPVVNHATPKLIVTITPTLTPSLTTPNFFQHHQSSSDGASQQPQQPITHFHFPPINSITAFNPLTLPQVSPGQASQIMHGGKLIPFVQGMPGPNSMLVNQHDQQPKSSPRIAASPSPSVLQSISISTGNYYTSSAKMQSPSLLTTVDDSSRGSGKMAFRVMQPIKNGMAKEIWSPAKLEQNNLAPKKSFNFTRIADNISPRKKEIYEVPPPTAVKKEEIRYFNFENLISKSEILIKTPTTPAPADCKPEPMVVDPLPPPPQVVTKPKFLRPNSLPLKPGTFTPKRHHGITPTHNTMPLISPETPRQSKSCRELYFNGHAYTNIGLKSSTKPFYCTVNKTQPFYVQTQKQLSMYSNWQVHPENDPHPLGLKAVVVMSLYDSSQQRDHRYSIATKQLSLAVVNSSSSTSLIMSAVEAKTNFPTYSKQVLPPVSAQNFVPFAGGGSSSGFHPAHNDDSMPPRSESSERTLSGGFESTEEYTYVRGRGRGKYVCKECGIRCKKPSMLKKHIRTHTDVRPYSCQYCSFHFKTKGNLTKHMKSKSHFKKCTELGLNPIPTSVDDDGGDIDIEGDQQSISSERTSTIPGDSDTGSDSDGDDSDYSDESKSRLPEHEAAHCLLSLSMTPPTGSQQQQQPTPKSYPSPVMQFAAVEALMSPQPMLPEPSQPSPRRVISFGNTPKVEFSMLKHEQYYSDPNLTKKKREFKDDDGAMPIDLTKKTKEPVAEPLVYLQQRPPSAPRSQVIVRVSDVVTPITGAANLLTTLVSNTDKIPVTSLIVPGGKEFDDSVYFQEYIKQRALQDSRMKQSQMKGLNNNQYEVEAVPSAKQQPTPQIELLPTVIPAAKVEKSYRIFNGKNEQPKQVIEPPMVNRIEIVPMTTVTELAPPPVKPVSYPSQEPKEALLADPAEPSVSRMDTLAEVAAGSVKLDSGSEPAGRPRSDSFKAVNDTGKESAKSVASEYLKLTKSVTLRKREDSESGTASDQDEGKAIAAAAPIVAPIVPPVVVVPPATALPATAEIGGIVARTVVVGEDGFKTTPPANEFASLSHFQEDGGRPVCEVCNKKFQKISQLKIHMNIHYMERKFRCEPCGTSFRSQGLFLKHERSATHRNKVSMTTTFGIATDSNPRPFYCKDCDVGFRIHGHLAKHLRSKMHVLKLECLGKLPFGTYTEIERSGTNLTEIDTTDCENSLSSLKRLAVRLNVKDPARVLPGEGGGAAIPSGSGNETDSCDDGQYENDSAGEDADMDDEEQPQVNNNHLNNHMKRKPDDSSTSNDSSSEETKRARFEGVPPGAATTGES
ncbi:hypothetical protein quinque_005347 [Culex quinquefasciatus]